MIGATSPIRCDQVRLMVANGAEFNGVEVYLKFQRKKSASRPLHHLSGIHSVLVPGEIFLIAMWNLRSVMLLC